MLAVDLFVMDLARIAHALHERRESAIRNLLIFEVGERRHRQIVRNVNSAQLVQIDLEQLAGELAIVLGDVVRVVLAATVAEAEHQRVQFRRPHEGLESRMVEIGALDLEQRAPELRHAACHLVFLEMPDMIVFGHVPRIGRADEPLKEVGR